LAQDHQELGAALNGFSLNERGSGEQQGHLSAALEKTGQANDITSASTTKLIQDLEQNWVEPVYEYSQFASIIRKLLVYRHQKQVQYEMTQDALVAKREQLEELEKSEREARRLEEALGRGRMHRSTSLPGRAAPEEDENEDEQEEEQDHPTQQSLPSLPPHPNPSTVRRRAPGMGFLSALGYTLSGMIDSDPETARRNAISRNRETTSQVASLQISRRSFITDAIPLVAGRRYSPRCSRPQVFELDHPSRPRQVPATESGGCPRDVHQHG
jgi:sorting nexin-41/42